MIDKITDVNETISSQAQTSTGLSYLIRPSKPCIFDEDYDDESINDDEFFLTAGVMIHSCPNIYELSINNNYNYVYNSNNNNGGRHRERIRRFLRETVPKRKVS